ncbi:hypothetical protein ACFXG3_21130, partial [Nocardia tengchongensis]
MSDPKDDQQQQGPANPAPGPAAGERDTGTPSNPADQSADRPENGKDAPAVAGPADTAPPTAATEA